MSHSASSDVDSPKTLLTNKTYDYLKFIALVVLPALGTLYFALAQIWGLPSAEEIVGTITAVDTFLGIVLKLQASSYNKSGAGLDGVLDVITSDPTKDVYQFKVMSDLEKLEHGQVLQMKVNKQSA